MKGPGSGGPLGPGGRPRNRAQRDPRLLVIYNINLSQTFKFLSSHTAVLTSIFPYHPPTLLAKLLIQQNLSQKPTERVGLCS